MHERFIEAYLKRMVAQAGGMAVKQDWVGVRGAPDRLVILPGRMFFVELKAPGQKPEPHQARLHEKLRALGVKVYVVDQLIQIDELLK